MPDLQLTLRLERVIGLLRWTIPLALGGLGVAYTLWQNVFLDEHSWLSAPSLLGLVLFGMIGPSLVFIALSGAARVATSLEHTERARLSQHQQLLALNHIGEIVNQSLELDNVVNRALDQVLDILHLESGQLRLIENGYLTLHTARGVSPAFIAAEPTLALGACLCGKSAQRGQLIAVEHLDRLPRFSQTACACEHFTSVLCAPVKTPTHVVGVIHVASQQPRVFDASERALLATIGYQVGIAIEKGQLYGQLKTLNQELEERVADRTRQLLDAQEQLARKADTLRQVLTEERRVEEKTRGRIAHELHDGVQQLIIGALFETQAARDALAQQHSETTTARLESTQSLLHEIETEMRRTIYNLRPLALDTQGLVPALRECVKSFERVTRLDCGIQVEGIPRRLTPETEVSAFRIVQEALNNVEAHAQAKCVRVRVAFEQRLLRVEIEDDGRGFDVQQVRHETRTHLGLIGMQERAESIGGALEVWSEPAKGAQIRLQVPLEPMTVEV